jgi:mono/diheme cytochrome c family protein
MPAFGKQLKPAEVDALVAFLVTLHPSDVPIPTSTVTAAGLADTTTAKTAPAK